MKDLSYWNRFMSTGDVEDYLKCIDHPTDNSPACIGHHTEDSPTCIGHHTEDSTKQEENPDAGLCNGNRNGVENSSCG